MQLGVVYLSTIQTPLSPNPPTRINVSAAGDGDDTTPTPGTVIGDARFVPDPFLTLTSEESRSVTTFPLFNVGFVQIQGAGRNRNEPFVLSRLPLTRHG